MVGAGFRRGPLANTYSWRDARAHIALQHGNVREIFIAVASRKTSVCARLVARIARVSHGRRWRIALPDMPHLQHP
jgi:hypothetical protein